MVAGGWWVAGCLAVAGWLPGDIRLLAYSSSAARLYSLQLRKADLVPLSDGEEFVLIGSGKGY